LSQIDNLRDPVRNTRWRFLIPSEVFAASGIQLPMVIIYHGEDGTDNFSLHVKSCKISRNYQTEENTGKWEFLPHIQPMLLIEANLDFSTILLEDMRAYEAMLGWEQACLNTGLLVDKGGTDRMNLTGVRLGLGNHKDTDNPTSQFSVTAMLSSAL
jgi:hypothetical protein